MGIADIIFITIIVLAFSIIIVVPSVWLWFKFKSWLLYIKLRKNKEEILKKIEVDKIEYKEVEDERKRYDQARRTLANKLVGKRESGVENTTSKREIERHRRIQLQYDTNPRGEDSIDGETDRSDGETDSDTQIDWE